MDKMEGGYCEGCAFCFFLMSIVFEVVLFGFIMDQLKIYAVAGKGDLGFPGAAHQKDQDSSDEEESGSGDEDEDSDEKEDTDKEEVEEDAAEYVDQEPENEGQSSKSPENTERNQVTVETIKKEVATPEGEISQQEDENAEVCATNNSSGAIGDNNADSTSGRQLGKRKMFSFFKRKYSRQKNAHSCDENSLEKLPQREEETGNQAGLPHKSSQDENQNHTEENQKEMSPSNQGRKTSSTCIVL